MSKQAVIRKLTLKITYKQKSTLNFSKLKLSATDQGIFDTATAFIALQNATFNDIFKVVEREICD